jgi:mannobiose 2-epimerase
MNYRVVASALLVMAMALPLRSAPADAEPPDTKALARQIEAELRGNILPFWLEHARDRERGGFYGEIRNDLTVKKNASRGALLTTRILWTFSAAYRRYHDPAYLEMARWAYDDLLAHFWDKENAGVYWRVSADGRPQDMRKITYVQAFAIYGLSEFYRATGEQPVLDRAIELYRTLELRGHDRANRGYFEEFSRDWKVARARGLFGGGAMTAPGQKSQNTHIHILEAFTNLVRAWPDPELRKNLREVADVLVTRVLDSSNHHLRLFLGEDWKPVSEEISFGHDIEFSWLITEAAEEIGDEAFLAGAKKNAVAIAEATRREGVDPDGGLVAEAGPHGVTDGYKEWWPQAEAAIGFFNAYQISGDPSFLRNSAASWAFIEAHLIDRQHGEWFQGVTREGKAGIPLKVSFWKCPYHNGRACMELLDRIATVTRAP